MSVSSPLPSLSPKPSPSHPHSRSTLTLIFTLSPTLSLSPPFTLLTLVFLFWHSLDEEDTCRACLKRVWHLAVSLDCELHALRYWMRAGTSLLGSTLLPSDVVRYMATSSMCSTCLACGHAF